MVTLDQPADFDWKDAGSWKQLGKVLGLMAIVFGIIIATASLMLSADEIGAETVVGSLLVGAWFGWMTVPVYIRHFFPVAIREVKPIEFYGDQHGDVPHVVQETIDRLNEQELDKVIPIHRRAVNE